MPNAQLAPVVAAPDVETAAAVLRARGLRMSAPRRQVIEALLAADRPVTADEIVSGLGGTRSALDQASVYANLATFEELGLVRHVHLGHGPGLWMLADRAHRDFLYCERCGTSQAVVPSVLAAARDAIRAETGFEARFSHFPITGLCANCARAQATAYTATDDA